MSLLRMITCTYFLFYGDLFVSCYTCLLDVVIGFKSVIKRLEVSVLYDDSPIYPLDSRRNLKSNGHICDVTLLHIN